jgi:hypothetical protein
MDTNLNEALDKVIDQFTEEEKELMFTNRFVYIFTKAWLYVKKGPEIYRKDDAFNEPPADYDAEELEILLKACKQVLEGIGMSSEKPFTGIDVFGFNALFRLFHFENVHRTTKHQFMLGDKRGILDCITFEHVMDREQVVYYNFCESPIFKRK